MAKATPRPGGSAPPWRQRWTPRPTCVGYANPAGLARKVLPPPAPPPNHKRPVCKSRSCTGAEPPRAQSPDCWEAGDAAGDRPSGHEPRPATSLPDPGGRKTIQDARHAVDLGRLPKGRLASAQCRLAIRTPGLRGRPAPGGGVVTVCPQSPGDGLAGLPGQGTPPTRRQLCNAPVGNAPLSRGADGTFAKTNRGSGPRGF